MISSRDWITPTERRTEVIKVLCKRRKDTIGNLAEEFGVDPSTIRKDIKHLSLSYPLETTKGRYGGGVSVIGDFDLDRRYLNPKQKSLLETLKESLSGEALTTMNSILNDFALN